jgi:hypothetical protein
MHERGKIANLTHCHIHTDPLPIFQIVITPLGDFQPRVLVDGIQLVALPPGRNLPQVPDVVSDRRREEVTAADPRANHDPGTREFPDICHVEIKQARETLPVTPSAIP